MSDHANIDPSALEALIAEASASGGAEMANFQAFIERLTVALDLPKPHLSAEENALNDYVFERHVTFKHANGSTSNGRIDLYKRGCFIMEAKQSSKRAAAIKRDADQLALLPEDHIQRKSGHAKRGTGSWDKIMLAARQQAESYARALPVEHGYPPFLIIVDVGNVIEIFADFSGQGKNYAHFPDRRSYRIALDDLREPQIQERLRAIWTDPSSLDPTRIAAQVTNDIARRLAKIAKSLEGKHEPQTVAEFLMRCLFTMFAEDVGLIPHESFTDLLEQLKDKPDTFAPALEHLWKVMDEGGYEPRLMITLKRFNGSLFKNRRALPLSEEDITELWIAAKRDWTEVEPAIFGTLLENALDPRIRSQLGAHYTPRTYVERLVIPTIIEPLRDDWKEAQTLAADHIKAGAPDKALKVIKDFHHKLCTTRVLDPACGSGNFLYVSLELMKRLEGEVLETLEELGEREDRLAMEGETVSPRQFYGLELNPRAVAIADLVLWLGYLKWQLKTSGLASITEPVLHAYGTIRQQDAVIAYDSQELLRDKQGNPLTRWDGVSRKLHPITGEMVPDEERTIELYTYANPRSAKWPEVEFIVGNPPFIGGKDMRAELGDGYAEACWQARKHVPGGADFVMHFWDQAAALLRRKGTKASPNPLRRFGFITTNSITMAFSRRVLEHHMGDKEPLSLVYAVADHPWMKSADKAAVRIAMTVAEKGEHEGLLAKVSSEAELNTDTPKVQLDLSEGRIWSNLMVGANLSTLKPLLANELICSRGVALHGAGFIVTPAHAKVLGLGKVPGLEKHILDYRNGRDLAQRPRGVMVIDLFPLSAEEARDHFPTVYQHVLDNVKPERDQNNRKSRKDNWWLFGEKHPELRDFLDNLTSYISTVETSKHRLFQFMDASIRPDNKLVNIGIESPIIISVFSSRLHVQWALDTGGRLGVGNDPVYVKTRSFNPFPFPLNPPSALGTLGERLDTFRKERLAAHEHLTMTGLYNVLERVRELDAGAPVEPLSPAEKDVYDAGQVGILKEIHDEIDRLTFAAYGWDDLAPALVGKPGGTVPSPYKSEAQEAAEQELLKRLVELNQQRWAEEQAGTIHWLRPDFQPTRLAHKLPKTAQQLEAELVQEPDTAIIAKAVWPKDGLEQIRAVRTILSAAQSPVDAITVSTAFTGRNTAKRKQRVADVLATLTETGAARLDQSDNQPRYFLP